MSHKIRKKDVDKVRDLIARAMNGIVEKLPNPKTNAIDGRIIALLCAQLISFAAYQFKAIGGSRERFIRIVALVIGDEWPEVRDGCIIGDREHRGKES